MNSKDSCFRRNDGQRKLWEIVSNLFFAVLIFAFIGARLGHVFFYEFAYYKSNLFQIFAVWQGGWSSYGGFIGAALTLLWFYKKHKNIAWAKIYDISAFAFVWGWFIGRMGCFTIHDHPGVVCPTCILGVEYPDGQVRADLGLYDGLLALFIGIVFLIGTKLKWFKREGSMAITLVVLYAIPRFFFDFLRAKPDELPFGDTRYAGLTPAQYLSIAAIVSSFFFILKWKKRLDEKRASCKILVTWLKKQKTFVPA